MKITFTLYDDISSLYLQHSFYMQNFPYNFILRFEYKIPSRILYDFTPTNVCLAFPLLMRIVYEHENDVVASKKGIEH